ncbi:MAG: ACT domain-containing protein [Candidatus Brocadiaceae bacterium]|jgi:hypothetical protein
MFRAKQLSVNLPNERGQLARLSRCMADAGVNIMAISVHDCAEAGTVRLVVDDAAGAAAALGEAGMAFIETDVVVAECPDRVGVLADVAGKLAEKDVNIQFVYGSTGESEGPTYVVFGCTDLAAAEEVLSAF